MSIILHVVRFTGPFGYIKPWSAVRDEETFSQLYLTGSILEGMSQKLFGLGRRDGILRHRLSYDNLFLAQERTLPKLVRQTKSGLPGGILKRRVMLNPVLHLAFDTAEDAKEAASQHLCLCRNEDLVFPSEPIEMKEADFDQLPGFEYLPTSEEQGIFHGWNRLELTSEGGHAKQYGTIQRVGEPMRLGEQFNLGRGNQTDE